MFCFFYQITTFATNLARWHDSISTAAIEFPLCKLFLLTLFTLTSPWLKVCLFIFFLLSFLPEARRAAARLYFCELSQIPVEPCQVCLVHARHIFRNLVARLPRCTCGTLRLRGGDHRIICHAQWVHVLMGAAIAADHICYY